MQEFVYFWIIQTNIWSSVHTSWDAIGYEQITLIFKLQTCTMQTVEEKIRVPNLIWINHIKQNGPTIVNSI